MGDQYVFQVAAADSGDLGGPAYRVLLRMALVVYDNDTPDYPEGLYFNGWRWLALPLGYGVIPEYSPMPKNAEKAVGRAIAELVAKGYIRKAPKPVQRHHRNRAYFIDLTAIFHRDAMAPRHGAGVVDNV